MDEKTLSVPRWVREAGKAVVEVYENDETFRVKANKAYTHEQQYELLKRWGLIQPAGRGSR